MSSHLTDENVLLKLKTKFPVLFLITLKITKTFADFFHDLKQMIILNKIIVRH